MIRRRRALARSGVLVSMIAGLLAPLVLSGNAAGADPIPEPIPCNPDSAPVPLSQPIADPLVVHAGLAGAPSYYELGFAVAPDTLAPKGYMLVVHGGGWFEHGPGKVQQLRAEAEVWRQRGWTTLNVTYRPCAQSIADVAWYYEQLRQLSGPSAVVCATGRSAGGHLVMLLAAMFADLDCAISQASPLDLSGLPQQLAYDDVGDDAGDRPPLGPGQSAGPRWVYAIAAGSFGEAADLVDASPSSQAAAVRARLLVATASSDRVVPLEQGRSFGVAVLAAHPRAYVDVHELPVPAPGQPTEVFVHGAVSDVALGAYRARELALVEPLLRGGAGR